MIRPIRAFAALLILLFSLYSTAGSAGTVGYDQQYLMKRFPLGRQIIVRIDDGSKYQGKIIEYNDSVMIIENKKTSTEIPYQKIRHVYPRYSFKPALIILGVMGGLLCWANALGS